MPGEPPSDLAVDAGVPEGTVLPGPDPEAAVGTAVGSGVGTDVGVDGPDRRRFWTILAVEVSVGIAAGVAYALTVGRHVTLGLDAVWYLLVGGSLAAGTGYSNPAVLYTTGVQRPTANFPPGYPGLVAALHEIGITTPTGLRIVGALLGGLTVLAMGLAGRRLTGRPAVGLVAAGITALLPALVATEGSTMSESLAVPLTAVLLLACTWAASHRRLWPWAVCGVLSGVLALTRAEDVAVLVVLVPLAALVGHQSGWRGRMAAAALPLVVGIALLAPWVVRNEVVFHPGITLSTNGSKTEAGSNCAATYSGPLLGSWDYACIGHAALADKNEGRFNQVVEAEGSDYARAHLSRLPLVAVVRALRAWGLYAPFQTVRMSEVQSRSVGFQQVAWGAGLVLLVVALPGMWLVRRNRLALVLLVGPPVLDTAVTVASFGNPRLLLASMPSLAIAAGVTSVAAWGRWTTRSGRRRAAV